MVKLFSIVALLIALGMADRAVADRRLPSQAEQAATLRTIFPAPNKPCKVSVVTAYDMSGFFYPATINVCQTGIYEVTSGVLAPKPGQRLFYGNGRAKRGSLYSLTRGYPNTAYRFDRNDIDQHGYAESYRSVPGSSWNKTVVALPFVPTGVIKYELNGTQRYAYAALRILPGQRSNAYPLNEDSAIIMMDNRPFVDIPALVSYLSYNLAGDMPYVEVHYVQLSERPQEVRHAFIPFLSLRDVGEDWRKLTSASFIDRAESSKERARLAVFASILTLYYAYHASGAADAVQAEREACERRQAASRAPIICW